MLSLLRVCLALAVAALAVDAAPQEASALEFSEYAVNEAAPPLPSDYFDPDSTKPFYEYGLERRMLFTGAEAAKRSGYCYINSTRNDSVYEYIAGSACCGTCTGRNQRMDPTTCLCSKTKTFSVGTTFNNQNQAFWTIAKQAGFRFSLWRALKELVRFDNIRITNILPVSRRFFERSLLQTGSTVLSEFDAGEFDITSEAAVSTLLADQTSGLNAQMAADPALGSTVVARASFPVTLIDSGEAATPAPTPPAGTPAPSPPPTAAPPPTGGVASPPPPDVGTPGSSGGSSGGGGSGVQTGQVTVTSGNALVQRTASYIFLVPGSTSRVLFDTETFSAGTIVSTTRLASLFSSTNGRLISDGRALPGGLVVSFMGRVEKAITLEISRVDRRRQSDEMEIRQAWLNKRTGEWTAICETTSYPNNRVVTSVPASVFNDIGFNPSSGCDSTVQASACTGAGGTVGIFEVPLSTCPQPEIDEGGLTGGEIAGIVIGSVFGALLLCALAFFAFRAATKDGYKAAPTQPGRGAQSDFVMAPAPPMEPAPEPASPAQYQPWPQMEASPEGVYPINAPTSTQAPYDGSPPPFTDHPPGGWAQTQSQTMLNPSEAYNRPPVPIYEPQPSYGFQGSSPPPPIYAGGSPPTVSSGFGAPPPPPHRSSAPPNPLGAAQSYTTGYNTGQRVFAD